MDIWEEMQGRLQSLAEADLLRAPRVLASPVGATVTLEGRRLVCFCSNDYLSLANDAEVRQAAIEAIEQWGVGSGASRLVSGTMTLHEQLETALADFEGAEAVAVASTGWMANHLAIHALVGQGDLVLCDKLNHASILDAARSCGARMRTYTHRDSRRLTGLLERLRGRFRRCLIVTDSLFSMDGDLAALGELVEIKRRFDALLMIDEAHATGVFGGSGRGLAEEMGVENDVDLTVGTLSKALGALGGFVAGRRELVEIIRNTGRPYIFTTALPPAICAAAMRSLQIVRDQPERRRRLLAGAEQLRSSLADRGLDTLNSASQIIPVVLGSARRAMEVSRILFEAGFFVPAIRPPTVPSGTSRLRISLCANHAPKDIEGLVDVLDEAAAKADP